MLLPFTDSLVATDKFDAEMAQLADRHYSRKKNKKHGSAQFMPPGMTLVIRDAHGEICFGWVWQQYRNDDEEGFNCSIFRNESKRLSSEIILYCEWMAVAKWGMNRMFTFVDPDEVSENPGFCFKQAGWEFVRKTERGLHLLEKYPNFRKRIKVGGAASGVSDVREGEQSLEISTGVGVSEETDTV